MRSFAQIPQVLHRLVGALIITSGLGSMKVKVPVNAYRGIRRVGELSLDLEGKSPYNVAMKKNLRPISRRKRRRTSGFLTRMSTRGGRDVLKRRRRKQRRQLTVA